MRLLPSVLVLSISCALVTPAPAQDSHLEWRAVADEAYARKDYAAARIAVLAALEIQPDSPRYLRQLAAVAARLGDSAESLEALRRLAALGVTTSVDSDPDFAPLQTDPGFVRILHQLADNRAPRGGAEVLAELPGRTGVIEGIAFRVRTGDLFLGDVHHRTIWRRDHSGRVFRFIAEDEELFGVFGLALDEERDTLWAATSALPAMSGYTADLKGQSALADFELSTGKLRRVIPVPIDGRDHALNDLIVGPDGTVYATDGIAPVIWEFNPGAEELQKTIESPLFHSLQGIVISRRTLFVADHAHGLFSVDLATRSLTHLEPPAASTLVGLDGMTAVPGGLAAVQNGVEPSRVVRIELAPDLGSVTGVTVLASGQTHLDDLALVTLIGDRPAFVAGAGWNGFNPPATPTPRSHTVRIFQTPLPEP